MPEILISGRRNDVGKLLAKPDRMARCSDTPVSPIADDSPLSIPDSAKPTRRSSPFAVSPTDPAGDAWVGRRLASGYRLERVLGSGAMATVYLAEREGRRYAIKVVHEHWARDRAAVARFEREAQAAQPLRHGNIVEVLSSGREDGRPYLVLEHVRGGDLSELLWREGPLDPRRAVCLVWQILTGLAHAHDRGVVHRDIKPENILLQTTQGAEIARIADFGLIKSLGDEGDEVSPSREELTSLDFPTLTETFSILGTPEYMAPEQAYGARVDARADLYAVGVLLFELLTGRVPFEGETGMETAIKQVTEPAPDPCALRPTLCPDLAAIVLQAMQKPVLLRFQNARALRRALEDWLAQDEARNEIEDELDRVPATERMPPISASDAITMRQPPPCPPTPRG